MKKVIECVPNFSEGRDPEVIRQITAAIESVDGISLLNVDPGASTNRTVVTFAGAILKPRWKPPSVEFKKQRSSSTCANSAGCFILGWARPMFALLFR